MSHKINLNEAELRELQLCELEALEFFDNFCRSHGLTYYLCGGSLIGALRHKGFIPWDDDLDIAMPRDDYEKLIKILNKKKSELYELQYEKNEKKYYLQFVKIRKKGTTFIEEIAKGMYDNNGIFIDIIPLDFAKDKKEASIIKALKRLEKKRIVEFNAIVKYAPLNIKQQLFKDFYKRRNNF